MDCEVEFVDYGSLLEVEVVPGLMVFTSYGVICWEMSWVEI